MHFPPKSQLAEFLVLEKNSVTREHLLTTRLLHDLSTAAAVRGYDLAIYLPVVDRDGFDLIVDDRDTLMPIQLKSFAGAASKWKVHRRLLRPTRHYVTAYGFEESPRGEGLGGGVILIDIQNTETQVTPSYLYTDINVLTAWWLDIIKRQATHHEVVRKVRGALEAEPHGKVTLTKSSFLRARTPEHLLALAGLHSRFHGAWPNQLFRVAAHDFRGEQLPVPRDIIVEDIRAHLAELCTDTLV